MESKIAIVGGGPAGLCLAGIFERNGIDYIVYERSARNTPPRGGCLDLRVWGQNALKAAGCYDAWNKVARRGDAQIMTVVTGENELVTQVGTEEGHDSPEADRTEIKEALLTSVPNHKIRWSANVDDVRRDSSGAIVIYLGNGEEIRGHPLVVGADGVFSKVRKLVTSIRPKYSGIGTIPRNVFPGNPGYADVEKLVGIGSFVVLGEQKMIWAQRQGDGHYHLDFQWPHEQGTHEAEVDLSDETAVKAYLLHPDRFGKYSKVFQNWVEISTGPSHTWDLFYDPPESLNWEPSADVTLIGDAAHATTPFVGEGANIALEDTLVLFQAIQKHGITKQAIAEYEADMFRRGSDVVTRSNESQALFFHPDGPEKFKKIMNSEDSPLHFSAENRVY